MDIGHYRSPSNLLPTIKTIRCVRTVRGCVPQQTYHINCYNIHATLWTRPYVIYRTSIIPKRNWFHEKKKQVLTDTAAVKCYESWASLVDPGEVDEPAEHDDKHTGRHVVFQNVNFFLIFQSANCQTPAGRNLVELKPPNTRKTPSRNILRLQLLFGVVTLCLRCNYAYL